MIDQITPTEREALELAARRCEGPYTLDHIRAWKELTVRGLVRNVRSADAAWYELTDAGRALMESRSNA